MSNIGTKVLKIALIDAVEKQQLIVAELAHVPDHPNVQKLVAEQTLHLEEILTLLNRIAQPEKQRKQTIVISFS